MKKILIFCLLAVSVVAFTQVPDIINVGTGYDTHDGDSVRRAFIKTNAWHDYLKTRDDTDSARIDDTEAVILTAEDDIENIQDSLIATFAATATNTTHRGLSNDPHSVTKTQVGLSNVENTKLSTWVGSTNITTLGTVVSGTYNSTITNITQITNRSHTSLSDIGNDTHDEIETNIENIQDSLENVWELAETHTYNANWVNDVASDGIAGDAGSLTTVDDADALQIEEASGATAFDTRVSFKNVTEFNNVQVLLEYTGGAGHEVHVELYNPNTTGWVEIVKFGDMDAAMFFNKPVINGADYIDDDSVIVRFNHDASGIASHYLWIDYLVLKKTPELGGGGVSSHLALSNIGTDTHDEIETNTENIQDSLITIYADVATAEGDIENIQDSLLTATEDILNIQDSVITAYSDIADNTTAIEDVSPLGNYAQLLSDTRSFSITHGHGNDGDVVGFALNNIIYGYLNDSDHNMVFEKVTGVVYGDSPDIDIALLSDVNFRDGSPVTMLNADLTITSTTSGDDDTDWNDPILAPGEYFWVRIDQATGAPKQLILTYSYYLTLTE